MSHSILDCSFEDGKTFFFEGKYYRIITEEKTWRGAQKTCQKLGAGRLAEGATEREHRFIQLILEMYDGMQIIGIIPDKEGYTENFYRRFRE